MDFSEPIPLAVYIHLPWCVRKCPYCDFNSFQQDGELPEREYVAALLADLDAELPRIWGRRIESVFIGGGTPSLFSAAALEALLDGLRMRLPLRPSLEITLEANPGTFEQARFADYRRLGINRLSIGIQSFDTAMLQRLGRIHDGDEARRAVDIARRAGFSNINLDLMFGLPGQDAAAARADLDAALACAPEHISYYQLTLEPNTLFHARPPELPDDDLIGAIQQTAQDRLAAAGYAQYEVSAYAQPGKRCRHNLNYWTFGDYLGLGAGAHGKLTQPADGSIVRRWKLRQPAQYLAGVKAGKAWGGEERIAADARVFEFMLNALRLHEGFDLALFEARTGLSQAHLTPGVEHALARDLLEVQGAHLRPSPLGWRFLNDLIALFLPGSRP
ncbi:radical SAM family heme chaperone HemW [Acidihalobacter ferrooxydans]|uniref:Heme chaperone HemW n=1 Tax=Acidihalobacter ferrooxydans TaxID=1765967 RepID=A0A1P8UJK4_9GAMM|nr:radical SAM family heme chaperone HemW [Acidihalobacter ferrooxydans]APZ44025.1 YggW family oxidoreductase [Acidihalobacter ferrooxydans]